MNGTDLKKITATLLIVPLVFIALQAGTLVSQHQQFFTSTHIASPTKILSTPNFVEMDEMLLQAPIEICTQSYPQRGDFKKTFSQVCHTLFQTSVYPSCDADLILKKGALPSTPFYISYCNMLI